MKSRKIIGIAAIAACFALCAAVWSQNEAVKKVPAPPTVTAPDATVEGFEMEIEMVETEKVEMPQQKSEVRAVPEAKPVPAKSPAGSDIQPMPESEAVAEQTTKPLRT